MRDARVSVTVAPALTLEDAARMMREALKDRSYRATPLGLHVARYYRWKKNEWGATAETLRDYEAVLARLCLYYPDLELHDFAGTAGTRLIRDVWDHWWGEKSARTRAKVRSVWIDFFEWCVREEGLQGNPARALTAPKKRDTPIEIFSDEFVERVIAAQTYAADELGALLILRYGLRRGGLGNVQFKHFDAGREILTVHTKGGRIYPLPVVDRTFWLKLELLKIENGLKGDHHLLYRQDTRKMRVPLADADEVLELGNGRQQGYSWITRRLHDRKPTGKLVHLWWYRCLERAGIVEKGTTGGTNMHRGRHTAITNLQRATHDLKLSQLLAGHKDIRSTARYAQMDTSDLAAALLRTYGED